MQKIESSNGPDQLHILVTGQSLSKILSRDIVNILRILYKFLVQTTDYITILVPTFFSLTIKNICLMTEDTSLFILIQGFPVYNRT